MLNMQAMIHSKKSYEYKRISIPNMQSRLLHYNTKPAVTFDPTNTTQISPTIKSDPLHAMQTLSVQHIQSINDHEFQQLKEKIEHQAVLIYDLEMIVEEKNVQLDDLQHESQINKNHYITKTDEMQADIQRMHSDFIEEKHTLEKESYYYKCRVQQEQVLTRQLLQQIESLQKNQTTHVQIENQNPILHKEESICIVCNEHHDSYEQMNCNHLLCTDCFVNWYSRCINYNQNLYDFEEAAVFTCPMCRTPIDIRSS